MVIEKTDELATQENAEREIVAIPSVPSEEGISDSTQGDLNAQTREGVIRLAEYLRLKRNSEKSGLTRKARALKAYLKAKSLVGIDSLPDKKQGAKLRVMI